MAKAQGVVIKTDENKAHVLITRVSMCGDNCGSCGLCDNKGLNITAADEVNAKKGDRVEVEVSTKHSLFAAVLMYFVPLLLLIFGICIASILWNKEWLAFLAGVFLMAVWIFIIKQLSAKGVFKEKMEAKILRIIK